MVSVIIYDYPSFLTTDLLHKIKASEDVYVLAMSSSRRVLTRTDPPEVVCGRLGYYFIRIPGGRRGGRLLRIYCNKSSAIYAVNGIILPKVMRETYNINYR